MTSNGFESFPSAERINRRHLVVGQAEQSLHGEDFVLRNEGLQLFGVFDGLSSHGSGGIASRVTASAVEAYIVSQNSTQPKKAKKIMKTAIESAGLDLQQVVQEPGVSPGLRTTASVLWFVRDSDNQPLVIYGQVGDSRIYRYNNGSFRQIGWDESTKHGLTNSVSTGHNECDQAGKAEVQRGDRFVICSDGIADLWRHWPFFEDTLRIPDPQEAAKRFVELSYKQDDKSIIIIDIPR